MEGFPYEIINQNEDFLWVAIFDIAISYFFTQSNGETWLKMVQDKTDVRADDRADVLNKMLFIKCNVFITKTELIHL